MSLQVDIQKKPNKTDLRKIRKPEDIYNLEEVQEIKDAIQEHFLFIGLDRANHVRKVSLMGIGTSAGIYIDSKQLIRNAIINAFDKVVFVHNHPSSSIEPSQEDIHLTDITGKLMEVFNIELVDHLIVTEDNFASMKQLSAINKNYTNDNLKFMNNAFLIEENNSLKQKIEILKNNKIDEELYKKLKQKAEFKVEEYYEYMRYYKGIEDYTLNPIEEYLLESLFEYIDNNDVIEVLAKQFMKDFPGYIESVITANSKMVYATEHKEEYLKLGKLLDEAFYNNLYLEELEEEKWKQKNNIADNEEELNQIQDEQYCMKNNKYGLKQYFNGKRKNDKILEKELLDKIKDINDNIEQQKNEYALLEKKYNDVKTEQDNINKHINNISDKLEFDYKKDIEKKIYDRYYLSKSYDLESILNYFSEYKTAFIEENKKLEKIKKYAMQTEIEQVEEYSTVEDDEDEEEM